MTNRRTIYTLANYRSSGKVLIPFIKIGGAIRYRKSDLDKFLEDNTFNHTGEGDLVSVMLYYIDFLIIVYTIYIMNIAYDIDKNKKNIEKHNVSFEEAINFDFKTALITIDDRKDYEENRYIACGFVKSRLYILCFVIRYKQYRVFSFRKANKREITNYETINE